MLWNSSARSVRVGWILCWFAASQVDHWSGHGKALIGLVSRAECEQFKSVRTIELWFLPPLMEETRAQGKSTLFLPNCYFKPLAGMLLMYNGFFPGPRWYTLCLSFLDQNLIGYSGI